LTYNADLSIEFNRPCNKEAKICKEDISKKMCSQARKLAGVYEPKVAIKSAKGWLSLH
jgi:hypothetical protein